MLGAAHPRTHRSTLISQWARRQFLTEFSLLGGGFVAKFPNVCALPGTLLRSRPPKKTTHGPLFEEVASTTSGISWRHVNGRSPEYYLSETTGAGCAFLDYDNDGWMDIYLINSGKCDFFAPVPPLRNALYHNNRDGTFTDVTEKAGVMGGGYGMGVAVGDYNADGWPDLYVTQYARSILYHNNGNGTFTDVTDKAGVAAPGWASSAVWFDYDNDGRLDLFVCRFVGYDKSKNKFCGDEKTGERFYCIPRVYMPAASWLFHNNGDGTFTDVSAESGIAKSLGKAWGVVATDVNNDGWMDLFIANGHPDDKIELHSSRVGYKEPLLLFRNTGRTLENVSDAAGPAFAQSFAARGMAIGDFNNDGAVDVLVAINNGPPLLLKNVAAPENHWLGVRLIGKKSNPDAIGTKMTWQSGDLKRNRLKVGGGGYLSSHDPREVLGIGASKKIDRLEIRWPPPSERVETFTDLPTDRYITIVEGSGWK